MYTIVQEWNIKEIHTIVLNYKEIKILPLFKMQE
jgi:hypothetical protein